LKAKEQTLKGLSNVKNNKWLRSLLFVSAFSLAGWGISVLVPSFVPFWLLFGFSVIYSIEKWLSYYTRKYRILGKIYRLILNLSVLSAFGLIIWSGIRLFSHQLLYSPIAGSLIFLAELAFFVWMCGTVSKNSWRWPSMKLTVSVLVCIAVVFTFAGVPPLSTYKDTLITKWEDYQTERAAQQAEIEAEEEDRRKQELAEQRLTSVEGYAILFNEYRQSNGLNALTFTDDLNERASLRLRELELDYSHDSLGNYNLHLAENILWATYTLDNHIAFESWKGSPGHNANMLDASYKYTGYAIGGNYAVQLFTQYHTINGEPQLPPGWYWVD